MSANACVAYYGIRFEIGRDEIDTLESRSDSRIVAARKAGLKYFWTNFGRPGERYLLLIGAQLAILGPENSQELLMPSRDLNALMESTKVKLQTAGFAGEPALYLQWEQDE